MSDSAHHILGILEKRFGAQVCDFCGDASAVLPVDRLIEAVRLLRDELGFDILADETAVDYWPDEPRFHVVYHFNATQKLMRLSLRVAVGGETPSLPTLEGLYPNANWYEREVWDMFGIRFEGHSDPRRILMPYDWEGHPLRKDYPLGYEEPQFTFNFDDIAVRKHRAGQEEA
ncbi:MAG: NADH-quinone oxidoreductase subunit C [Chloroflexota bacterium]